MKGDLARVNAIPYAGPPAAANATVLGTGFTPEGIDQVRGVTPVSRRADRATRPLPAPA